MHLSWGWNEFVMSYNRMTEDRNVKRIFWGPCRKIVYTCSCHDDATNWKHFPRYWPVVRGIHQSPVDSPHKGQWRGALMFSLICAWINGWVNNRAAGDLRRHRAHYDVTVMYYFQNWKLRWDLTIRSPICNHIPQKWQFTDAFESFKTRLSNHRTWN